MDAFTGYIPLMIILGILAGLGLLALIGGAVSVVFTLLL